MTDDYLRGDFQNDRVAVRRLQQQVESLLKVFTDFRPTLAEKGWPYRLFNEQKAESEKRYSFSTNSMITFAVAAGSALLDRGVLMPTRRPLSSSDTQYDVRQIIMKSIVDFAHEADATQKSWKGKNRQGNTEVDRDKIASKDVMIVSGTFGPNDPFTLTWMLEICTGVPLSAWISDEPVNKQIRRRVVSLPKKLVTTANENLSRVAFCLERKPFDAIGPCLLQVEGYLGERLNENRSESGADALTHSFPLLRYIQLAQILETRGNGGALSEARRLLRSQGVRQTFLDTIHLQLSNHAIPGGAFDIAELVFALEGLLLVHQHDHSGRAGVEPVIQGVDPAIVRRVLQVVAENQQLNPSLRPLRPFIVTKQGLSLLPLSVEVANSLLRIWSMLASSLPTQSDQFAPHIGIFRRYEEWLRSRQVWGQARNEHEAWIEFTGWHSEHRMVAGSIDLWETSQVLLFYMLYAELLQRHLASRAILAARLRIIRPEQKPIYETATEFWDAECVAKKEAIRSLRDESRFRVLRRIQEDFISPRSGKTWDRQGAVSMLLYGPPGTGKTSIANDIAKALRWPLIELSPSDFIAEGTAKVEARAKDIFDALREQTEVVIFFDEIDHLILDRDSSRHERQGDIFQFMTPSMLTKFQDLHDVGQSIFIVGTNYAERIDRAIKRTGRIDRQYLVMPPDMERRQEILRSEIKKKLDCEEPALETVIGTVAERTPLATYSELTGLVSKVLDRPGTHLASRRRGASVAKLVSKVLDMPRAQNSDSVRKALLDETDNLLTALAPEGFLPRFGIVAPDEDKREMQRVTQRPYDELLLTLLLLAEAKKLNPNADAITNIANNIKIGQRQEEAAKAFQELLRDAQETDKKKRQKQFDLVAQVASALKIPLEVLGTDASTIARSSEGGSQ